MRVRPWILLAMLGLIGSIAAASLLCTTYMVYDDEGYVLYSLQSFVDGGGLYERVYSQYGPFFYLFNQAIHFGGIPFTNDGARVLTFFSWMLGSLLSGAIVWSMTRSIASTALGAAGTFVHLKIFANEPGHPGGLIVIAVALLAWLGVKWVDAPSRVAAAAGVIGAAVFFTKINIGIFVLTAAGAWWFVHLSSSRVSSRLRASVVGLVYAAFPFILMWDKLSVPWVATFATVSGCAGLATVIAATRGATPITTWRNLLPLAVGASVIGVSTIVAILSQGTSLRGLLEGVLLGPLRHPNAYTFPILWRPGAVILSMLSLALAWWASGNESRSAKHVLAAVRISACAAFLIVWALSIPFGTLGFAMSYGLAWTWLFVPPLASDKRDQMLRAWLAFLVVLQALHAYPVAGSQISWGTFLWIPLAVVGTREASLFLVDRMRLGQKLLVPAAAIVIIATLLRTGSLAAIGLKYILQSDSPGLPGTSLMRVPENLAITLRLLALNVGVHAEVLFTLPGMLSFHQWTGVPPATSLNATHWFTLLTLRQQEEVRAKLEAAPRSCMIVQRQIYDFLVSQNIATESPLTIWLKTNYYPAFALGSFEFWVRNNRSVAALGAAIVHEGEPSATHRYLVSSTVALPAEQNVATVEMIRFDENDVSVHVTKWTAGESRFLFTPVNSAGNAITQPQTLTTPFSQSALGRFDILTNDFPIGAPLKRSFLLFFNSSGKRIAEARFN